MHQPHLIKTFCFLLTLLTCAFTSNAQIFVDQRAIGNQNGSSWEHAFTNLQDGINKANHNEQIWIAQGIYLPGKSGDPQSSTFHIKKGVQIYGGFVGTEINLSERIPSKHLTILSGDLKQDDIPDDFATNRSDNVWTVMKIESSTTLPIIDGLTFKNGHAEGNDELNEATSGGGLYLLGPAQVSNCTFVQNFSSTQGGALYFVDSLSRKKNTTVENQSDFMLDACTFNKNFSANGGAINIQLKTGKLSSLLIQNTSFAENTSEEYGGALVVKVLGNDVNFKIDSCNFSGNQSSYDCGAISYEIYGKNNSISTQASTFSENYAAESCGAMQLFTSDSSANNIYTVSNSEFLNNSADMPKGGYMGGGGAIYVISKGTSNLATFENSNFFKNSAKGLGGALGIVHSDDGKNNSAEINNCSFSDNRADSGGGLYYQAESSNDTLLVYQSQFIRNSISNVHPRFATLGGAMNILYYSDSKDSRAIVDSCIFEYNQAKDGNGGALAISPFGQDCFASISNTSFTRNITSGKGGAFFYEGTDEDYTLKDCTFDDNQATEEGALLYKPQAFGKTQFYIFFHAILWFQMLYSLLLFFIARERTSLYYALMLFGISLFFLIVFDAIHFPFIKEISGDTNDVLYQIGVFVSIFGLIKFAQHYLSIDQLVPRFKKIIFYFLGVFLFFELVFCLRQFDLLGQIGESMRSLIGLALMLCFAIGGIIPIIWAIIAIRKGAKPAKYFLLAMLFYGGALIWLVFSYFQNGNVSAIPIVSIELLLLLSIITLALADGYRINALKKEKVRAERLSELDAAKTRLYTNITHEFRTPLTVIMGASEQVKGNFPEKDLIKRNSKQLLQLINQMLDLSKLEGGALSLDLQQGNIISFIEYLVESFQSLAESKHIRLTFYKEVGEIQMDYDAVKMQQIIINLISNAIKFTETSGKVVVHAKEESLKGKPHLTLIIRDNGAGIPAEDLPHIFDRFFQVDASDMRRSEGSGIGLALVKELVQLMKGTIKVESKANEGTAFILNIPISQQAPLQSNTIKENDFLTPVETVPEQASTPFFQTMTDDLPLALIIEDNKDIVSFLQSCLQRKYKIEVAYNGQQGIDKALDIIPDIIISDVMMPEADGFTVCKTLKTDERTSHVPIILLTAKATQEDKVQGLEVGADAYLSKPFHQEELEVRLQKLIELRQQLQLRYQGNSTNSTAPKNKEDEFLQKLKSIVLEKMEDDKFSINELCHAVGLSRMQVHRKLKALTGMPATAFINSIRLNKAFELLSDSDLNVSEVAYQVGFSNHSYFSKLFLNKFGKTPSEVSN